MPPDFRRAERPTMYFMGVTTGSSSINRVFPRWAAALGLGEVELRGWDFPLRADPARYRAAVEFIRSDPLACGALITSHKMDVFAAAADVFDEIDPLSRSLGEISSIYKRGGKLLARAADPWAEGHALHEFLPRNHWSRSAAEAMVLGAGGAGTALAWHLCRPDHGAERPSRIIVTDKNPARLAHLAHLHRAWRAVTPLQTIAISAASQADEILAGLSAGSLVVNATGMGKDTPGSPLTASAVFPSRGIVWELNYRGALLFLEQARAQQAARQLQVEDGWTCFLHGWTGVIADVFDRAIPPGSRAFAKLAEIAGEHR